MSPDDGETGASAADRADAGEVRVGPQGDRGILYVVATPIGNLGDVTLRSLEVLRAVPLVAAEDTRITRRLFARHGITTHLVPHHARNEAATIHGLLAHLRSGRDLALVTDAGTPLVSDPGAGLVSAWAAESGRVVPYDRELARIAASLNNRPRKTLGWKTPAEVLTDHLREVQIGSVATTP